MPERLFSLKLGENLCNFKQVSTTFTARLNISFISNLSKHCANIKAVKFCKAVTP